ncbi:conserved hypothetical protein [Xenorhabdus bovienii str. Jollieti]|uniref:BioF2-like acetyltransferase domain-containing protein n=1 Tax=Xenorhabdus bovienii (strain SS-2004) TaxID=406818 RepID=D3V6Z6_XENBS|nr:GNAT family N-acetyltransferase [Xenorhabdus bovienii]CBJ83425.1 conserved hypothetical protein [Xenorhabdus bovienii SS-2004]CDH29313.1 conserved hypothetical protein [Xenorhabdus bovienii str. Jollieti]
MKNNKELYKNLCETEKTIPIFSQAWWLDATAGIENWDVAIVQKENGEIIASLPYMIKKVQFLKKITQPKLTQFLGPWFKENNSNYTKSLGQQKDLMFSLIEQLPEFHSFSQNWNHSQQNWLPFYWKNFSQSTRYTYRITDISNEEKLWNGFQSNIRGYIRKAKERYELEIRTDLDIHEFLKLNNKVFERQNKTPPYEDNFVIDLDRVCSEKKSRKIFIAQDKLGRKHAGAYLIWDNNNAYYIMAGADPSLPNSGATSLCLWEAIKFASTVTKNFDFEGSMLEPVERFFRAFGAEQTPYFHISKTNSKILKTYYFLKNLK